MNNIAGIIITEFTMTALLVWIIYYVHRVGNKPIVKEWAVIILVLFMMGGMLDSLAYFFVNTQTFFSTIIALSISMLSMSVAVVYLALVATHPNGDFHIRHFSAWITVLLVWNEISMALLLYVIGYAPLHSGKVGSIPGYVVNGINNYLFIAPMASEMIFSVIVFKSNGLQLVSYSSIIVMSLFAPTLLPGLIFEIPGAILSIASMTFFVVLIFQEIWKNVPALIVDEIRFLAGLFLVYALMASGIGLGFLLTGPYSEVWAPLAIAMICGMVFYFYTIIGRNQSGS